MMDADRRARLIAAKREIAEILKPQTEAQRKARREAAKARRAAMKAAPMERQRQPREHDKAYLAFVRRQPCMICGTTRGVEAAHVRSGYPEAGWRPSGMQEKPSDHRTLPLCRDHHREGPKAQHATNERRWWSEHEIYPPEACARLRQQYEAGE
jgi:hypothetical protein